MKVCRFFHHVLSLDSKIYGTRCSLSSFSAGCLRAAYRGWPSSAWVVSSSWEPTRRSAALCCSGTSSPAVLSPDPVQGETAGKASPEVAPWRPPRVPPRCRAPLAPPRSEEHLVLEGRVVHGPHRFTQGDAFLLISALQIEFNSLGSHFCESTSGSVKCSRTPSHQTSNEASLLFYVCVNQWVLVLKTVSFYALTEVWWFLWLLPLHGFVITLVFYPYFSLC